MAPGPRRRIDRRRWPGGSAPFPGRREDRAGQAHFSGPGRGPVLPPAAGREGPGAVGSTAAGARPARARPGRRPPGRPTDRRTAKNRCRFSILPPRRRREPPGGRPRRSSGPARRSGPRSAPPYPDRGSRPAGSGTVANGRTPARIRSLPTRLGRSVGAGRDRTGKERTSGAAFFGLDASARDRPASAPVIRPASRRIL
jgi:hypothetical protein